MYRLDPVFSSRRLDHTVAGQSDKNYPKSELFLGKEIQRLRYGGPGIARGVSHRGYVHLVPVKGNFRTRGARDLLISQQTF
jgi:hypothetical protein